MCAYLVIQTRGGKLDFDRLSKSRCGHLVVDLIIGAERHKSVLTLFDRKSKYVWLAALSGEAAVVLSRALVRLLEPVKVRLGTTAAYSGKESTVHAGAARALEVGRGPGDHRAHGTQKSADPPESGPNGQRPSDPRC